MADYLVGDRIISMDQLMNSQVICNGDDFIDRSEWGKWSLNYADAMIRGRQLYKAHRITKEYLREITKDVLRIADDIKKEIKEIIIELEKGGCE